MKKALTFVAAFVVIGLIGFEYSGADSLTSFWEWLRSLATRLALKTNALTGDLTMSDNLTQGVSIALDKIAGFESFSSKAYLDPSGQFGFRNLAAARAANFDLTRLKISIAYGHQIIPGDGLSADSEVSESDGYALLSNDVQKYVDCVSATVDVSQLTANQIAALISFTYNDGCAAFEKSTMAKLINAGDLEGAANEFPKWVYANGVVNADLQARRAAEEELFNA